MLLIALVLFWFGLCLGSFTGAMVWRLRHKKDWVRARSQCEHCRHTLGVLDLVPLVSWLALRGRCRYCKKPIGLETLAVELAGGLTFALSYIYWPQTLHGGQLVLFITWLVCSVGLLALLVYDLRWMLLPSKILYPTAALAAAGRLIYLIGFEQYKLHSLFWWILSVLAASGIFWLLFVVSRGGWIGYGDVRLGLITGTLLANPAHSLLMIMAASVLGTVVVLPALLAGRKALTAKLPFGPFLIVAAGAVLLFGAPIINWYTHLSIR
jgi:prepilin signal peptidase PulO-like enzyme (type II secretory pathway)